MPPARLTPEERLAHIRASKKRWKHTHREAVNAEARRRRARDPQKYRDACTRSRAAHPETGPQANKRWRQNNPEKVRAHKRQWNTANRQQINEQRRQKRLARRKELNTRSRAKYAANPDYFRAAKRLHYSRHVAAYIARAAAWAKAHPEKMRTFHRQSRQKHAEKHRISTLAWRRKHPESVAASSHRRRARRLAVTDNNLTTEHVKNLLAAAKGVCVYCPAYNPGCPSCKRGTHTLTIDHIIPLSKGGAHTLHNLIACCRSCNSKKHTGEPPVPVQPLLL